MVTLSTISFKNWKITGHHICTSKGSLLQHSCRSMPFSRYFKTFHGWMLGDTSSFEIKTHTELDLFTFMPHVCLRHRIFLLISCMRLQLLNAAKELWLKALLTGSGYALIGMFCISQWCSLLMNKHQNSFNLHVITYKEKLWTSPWIIWELYDYFSYIIYYLYFFLSLHSILIFIHCLWKWFSH